MGKLKAVRAILRVSSTARAGSHGATVFWRSTRAFLAGLLRMPRPSPDQTLDAPSLPHAHHATVDRELPCEIACMSEHEANTVAERMIALGYAAEAQHNVYDYSWSVEVRSRNDVPPAT